jgi:hypothetical protein
MEYHPIVKIKMKRPYGAYKAGESVEVDNGLAVRLLAWDYATRDLQPQLLETASLDNEVESADVNPKKKKRTE